MNTNAEYCPASRRYASQGFAKVPRSLVLAPRSTSNAEHRTQEAKIAARMAHLSLLVLFGSALEVRCSMFDVRISLRSIRLAASCNRRGSRAATDPIGSIRQASTIFLPLATERRRIASERWSTHSQNCRLAQTQSPRKTASGDSCIFQLDRTLFLVLIPYNHAGKSALRLRNPCRVSPIGHRETRLGKMVE